MEEEQGKSVHENNIMGKAIFKTLQYIQRIRLFEKKGSLQHMRERESKRNDCCFFFYFHMRKKIVSA